jgi:hypothetical protein
MDYFMELIAPSQAALDLAAAKAARACLSTAANDQAVAAEHRIQPCRWRWRMPRIERQFSK